MGWGDELMGSGLARAAAARGKRAAFGDGRQIRWSEEARQIYWLNPDVASPGEEGAPDLEWIRYYKGHRIYGTHQSGIWTWNRAWSAIPGRVVFSEEEIEKAQRFPADAVLIEPSVKAVYPNKAWPVENFVDVARRLRNRGHRVVQFDHGSRVIDGIQTIRTNSFRDAIAMMRRATLYIGPEGGLHHGAAAIDAKAVVIFGGYIHPRTTGYATHINFFGAEDPCGKLAPCEHCRKAMLRITADQVFEAAVGQL